MQLTDLGRSGVFPDVSRALSEPDGLLCFGGDLSVARLLEAYRLGIFPWYSEGEPICWWSPQRRMVLFPEQLHISRSMKRHMRQHKAEFFFNRNFEKVIHNCAKIPRKQHGTWIHPEMIAAYCELFAKGHGFCLEVELNGELAGGIYGVVLSKIYCGESMFSVQSNGSKYALWGLCQHLLKHNIKLLDCQLYNPHLARMGASEISRSEFLTYL